MNNKLGIHFSLFFLICVLITGSCEPLKDKSAAEIDYYISLKSDIDSLLAAKVTYEESEYRHNVVIQLMTEKIEIEEDSRLEISRQVKTNRTLYHSRVRNFKQEGTKYKHSVMEVLAADTLAEDKFIAFSYQSPISSNIGPCTYLSRKGVYQLLLYNLENVAEDSVLVCSKEILELFD